MKIHPCGRGSLGSALDGLFLITALSGAPDLIQILHGGLSFEIANGGVQPFHGRSGVDLHHLIEENSVFSLGASVADKVVGKAAVALDGWDMGQRGVCGCHRSACPRLACREPGKWR